MQQLNPCDICHIIKTCHVMIFQPLLVLVIEIYCNRCPTTVDVEKFAGLNIHGFNPIEVFAEILKHFFSQKCL